MRHVILRLLIAFLLSSALPTAGLAGDLTITPVSLDIAAPSAAAVITLKNSGRAPVKMQIRAFAWTQDDRNESLQRTREIAVSPPFVDIKPNGSAVVRVVRISKKPLAVQESYRLLVDEVPIASTTTGATVQVVMRHSIPVFFSSENAMPPQVELAASNKGGQLHLVASNRGAGYLKLWNMSAQDRNGRVVSFGNGLNGYVLAGSAQKFSANGPLKGSEVTILGNSNYGPISWATRLAN